MSALDSLGLAGRFRVRDDNAARTEQIVVQHPLHRVLSFTRRSIDDVVNDPIAKNEVLGYFKLYKQVERSCEITEMERAWNSLGR